MTPVLLWLLRHAILVPARVWRFNQYLANTDGFGLNMSKPSPSHWTSERASELIA
jgi:hypothetical protein